MNNKNITLMADVVTKFYYLQHGKQAPKNSEFKGIISTKSILGFKAYTKRKKSKELSDAAKLVQDKSTSFFDYTSKRFGATKTFSSNGWLDNSQKHNQFKCELSKYFNKDGDILWTPVISLSDFMKSTEMKLYNEEDYAAVFSKILPTWFKQAGFKKDNMIWWMDYHVNTDNPHVHLNFLEKEKSPFRQTGKLPLKYINSFKSLFWKEVFAKKRYLEETNISAKEGFKNKDLLKKETYLKFKKQLKNSKDEAFISNLKALYRDLPSSGRLQYNSTHMMAFRERIDQLVDQLLNIPDVQEGYRKFMSSVKEFDEIRSKNIGTSYNSFTVQEDKKLRTMLANEILREYKNIDNSLLNLDDKNINIPNDNKQPPPSKPTPKKMIHLPVARSLLLRKEDNNLYIRIPKMGYDKHAKCILLDIRSSTLISEQKGYRVFNIDANRMFTIFDANQKDTGQRILAENLHPYFSEGIKYLKSYYEQLEKRKKWEKMQQQKQLKNSRQGRNAKYRKRYKKQRKKASFLKKNKSYKKTSMTSNVSKRKRIYVKKEYKKQPRVRAGGDTLYLPVAKSLITKVEGNKMYIRVPRSGAKNYAKYIVLDKRKSTIISEKKQFRVFEISSRNSIVSLLDSNLKDTGKKMSAKNLHSYFSQGADYLNSYYERLENKDKWEMLQNQQIGKNEGMQTHNWKRSSKRLQRASFSWMNEIEHEVNQARDEYLYGKEFTLC